MAKARTLKRRPRKPDPEPVKMHRYRVLRACFWNNRLWDPDVDTYVLIATETTGIPPHHFRPMDGGPVEPIPEGSIFSEHTAPPAPDEPTTLSEVAKKTGKPIGEPGQESGAWSPDRESPERPMET